LSGFAILCTSLEFAAVALGVAATASVSVVLAVVGVWAGVSAAAQP
jgi:hypothetical protein